MTKLYQITIPTLTNAGHSYAKAHDEFANALLYHVGGYTVLPVVAGAWVNDKGVIMRDTSILYQIACEPAQFAKVQRAAFDLFPDQLAIIVAEIGTADIIERKDVIAA